MYYVGAHPIQLAHPRIIPGWGEILGNPGILGGGGSEERRVGRGWRSGCGLWGVGEGGGGGVGGLLTPSWDGGDTNTYMYSGAQGHVLVSLDMSGSS